MTIHGFPPAAPASASRLQPDLAMQPACNASESEPGDDRGNEDEQLFHVAPSDRDGGGLTGGGAGTTVLTPAAQARATANADGDTERPPRGTG